jgi:[ribosomal protein S5]-alanine N-acetyltransferase
VLAKMCVIVSNAKKKQMYRNSRISTNFPSLLGLLVNLRRLSANDAERIAHLMNYNISKYLYEVPNPYKIEDALNFIKSSDSDFNSLRAIHFAIEYKEYEFELGNKSQPLVGVISLKNIDLVNKTATLGYWIGEDYWGKGIATECVRLIIDYGFSKLELEEISAYVFPENEASIRVLEKNGMNKKEEVNEYHPMSGKYRSSLKYVIQGSDPRK